MYNTDKRFEVLGTVAKYIFRYQGVLSTLR